MAEFALRMATWPSTLPAWSAGHISKGTEYMLKSPSVARAARLLALSVSSSTPGGHSPLVNPTDWGVAMRRLTRLEVHETQTQALGLDPSALDLTSVECIAAALRRAAGILCPCPPKTLVSSVVQALQHLAESPSDLREDY